MGVENGGFSPNGNGIKKEGLLFSRPQNRVTNEHQIIQRQWQELIYDGTPDVVGRMRQFLGEAQEAEDEIRHEHLETINNLPNERKTALGEEVVDTIIAGLGVLDTLGLDFETMFFKKLEVMYTKYNPGRVAELQSQGLTHEQTMAQLKNEWNLAHPRNPQNGT